MLLIQILPNTTWYNSGVKCIMVDSGPCDPVQQSISPKCMYSVLEIMLTIMLSYSIAIMLMSQNTQRSRRHCIQTFKNQNTDEP